MHKTLGLLAAAATWIGGSAHAALFIPSVNLLAPAGPSIEHAASQDDRSMDWLAADVVLSLPKFDPSLGLLHTVTLSFSGQLVSDYTLVSGSGDDQTASMQLQGNMQFGLPGGSTDSLDLQMAEVGTLAGNGTLQGWMVAFATTQRVLSADLADYIGPGSIDIGVLPIASWWFHSDHDVASVTASTSGNAEVRVRYDYAEASLRLASAAAPAAQVPEPSALALVGLALAAAGLTRRRPA